MSVVYGIKKFPNCVLGLSDALHALFFILLSVIILSKNSILILMASVALLVNSIHIGYSSPALAITSNSVSFCSWLQKWISIIPKRYDCAEVLADNTKLIIHSIVTDMNIFLSMGIFW